MGALKKRPHLTIPCRPEFRKELEFVAGVTQRSLTMVVERAVKRAADDLRAKGYKPGMVAKD